MQNTSTQHEATVVAEKNNASPRRSTLAFLKNFARTCATIDVCESRLRSFSMN